MSRLILIFAIIALVYLLLKSYRKQSPGQRRASHETQDMVSCANCGINLPKNEALLVNGKYYCCTAHSRTQEK